MHFFLHNNDAILLGSSFIEHPVKMYLRPLRNAGQTVQMLAVFRTSQRLEFESKKTNWTMFTIFIFTGTGAGLIVANPRWICLIRLLKIILISVCVFLHILSEKWVEHFITISVHTMMIEQDFQLLQGCLHLHILVSQ